MSKSKISVITVVFNGEKYLEQTIKSVLDQTYKNVEYLIIDGGSTDGTLAIIKRYESQIDYWVSELDNGIFDAMNKGIARASGELINLLNADDFLEPDTLESVAERYHSINQPCVIYGHASALDDKNQVAAEMYSHPKYWRGMTINHQSMFVHKEVYQSVGLYDTQYRYAGDYDFLVRTFRQNIPYFIIDKVMVHYRLSGQSTNNPECVRESNIINKQYFGHSMARQKFLLYNYVWQPLKFSVRSFLYRTVGAKRSRKIMALYKRWVQKPKAIIKS
ncbi:MAG: glycosyltransferase [bacterium]|nr:MAG: glycosyltransferase [bacterium]